jgi:hypothetical protein
LKLSARTVARFAVPFVAMASIAALVVHNPAPIAQVAQSIVTSPVGTLFMAAPVASPTSAAPLFDASVGGALVVTPMPSPSPLAPIGPQAFPLDPVALGNVPAVAPAAPGVTPAPAPQIPATMCTLGADSIDGKPTNGSAPPGYFDVNTGGFKGKAPMTVVWHAYFQGGFVGATPTFAWSGGGAGTIDSVTYSTPGTYRVTLTCSEVYSGVTYAAGSANGVPVTVS